MVASQQRQTLQLLPLPGDRCRRDTAIGALPASDKEAEEYVDRFDGERCGERLIVRLRCLSQHIMTKPFTSQHMLPTPLAGIADSTCSSQSLSRALNFLNWS